MTLPEVTTVNNTVTTSIFIYQEELTPIYPYNYAIINKPFQKLYASTANPFAPLTQYVMEIDTTEAFNSSLKVSKNISSIGGVFEFDPGIKYHGQHRILLENFHCSCPKCAVSLE